MKTKAPRKITAFLLSFLLVFSTFAFSLNVSLKSFAAPYLDYSYIVANSNFPVINISIENGEAPDKVNKETKKNATFEITDTDGNVTSILTSTATNPDTGEETTVWPMTIKGRGNSSWNQGGVNGKKPYNIKFASKQDLLGMGKQKSYSLIASWLDTSFIRNYTAYKLGKQMKTNAMDCELVELCINGKYEGFYLLTEKYGLGNTRIVTAGDGSDLNGDGEITQFLVETDSRAEENREPNRFSSSAGSTTWFVIKEPDEDTITSADDFRFLHAQSKMQDLDQRIVNVTEDSYPELLNYMDIDSFIDTYIVNELAKNPDFGYGDQVCYASTFMNFEEGGKVNFGTIWDFDIGFGRNDFRNLSAEGNRDTYTTDTYLSQNTKWVRHLFNIPAFQNRVNARWAAARPAINSVISTLPTVVELAEQSASWDFETWGNYTTRNPGYAIGRDATDYSTETAYVLNFIDERLTWLDEQWEAPDYSITWARSEELSTANSYLLASSTTYNSLISDSRLALAYADNSLVNATASDSILELYNADNKKSSVLGGIENVWDGGHGYSESSDTKEIIIGTPQGDVSESVPLEQPYNIVFPASGNVYNCWKDGSATGGFGGNTNTITASTSGRYVYAGNKTGWWFDNNKSFSMGTDCEIYIVDISANGSVTLYDGILSIDSTNAGTRTVTIADTNYGYLSVSGNTITVSFKSNQTGNTGTTIGGSGSSMLKLSFDPAFDGTLEKVNRPADSAYSSIPVSFESTYIYYEGVKPVSWTIKNKATGADDNGAIITFDSETRKISANGTGTVIITAIASDGTSATIEVSSSVTTASEVPTKVNHTIGKYYTGVTGNSSCIEQWATFTGGDGNSNLRRFTGYVDISAEQYSAADAYSLGTLNLETITGAGENIYVFVNGIPFYQAVTDSSFASKISGFTAENTFTISQDSKISSSYPFTNGYGADISSVTANLKGMLHAGANKIDVFAGTTGNGSTLIRPYLFTNGSSSGGDVSVTYKLFDDTVTVGNGQGITFYPFNNDIISTSITESNHGFVVDGAISDSNVIQGKYGKLIFDGKVFKYVPERIVDGTETFEYGYQPLKANGVDARLIPDTSISEEYCIGLEGVYYGPTPEKMVCFTFDDGPSEHTPELLDSLQQLGAKATFFLIGQNAEQYPETVARMFNEGHTVGVHSYAHPHPSDVLATELASFGDCADVIKNITGYKPAYARPPYGEVTSALNQALTQLDLKKVLWDIDPNDWSAQTADEVYNETIAMGVGGINSGNVILLHDKHEDKYWPEEETTIPAVPRLIEYYQAQGYTFVSLDEYYARTGVYNSTPATGEGEADISSLPMATATITIIPETTVYYEDNFANSNNADDALDGKFYFNDVWQVEGNEALSGGSAHRVGTVLSPDTINTPEFRHERAEFTFKFTGTGFDVISRVSASEGILGYTIYKAAQQADGTFVKGEVYSPRIKMALHGTNGDKDKLNYQEPVICKTNMPLDSYIVEIFTEWKIAASSKGNEVYIDGIRIYNTSNETDTQMFEARDAVLLGAGLTPDESTNSNSASVIMIDNGDTVDIDSDSYANVINTRVLNYSKNELILDPGESMTFTYAPSAETDTKFSIQARKVTDNTKVTVTNGSLSAESDIDSLEMKWLDFAAMTGGSDRKRVTVTNSGSSLLSISRILISASSQIYATEIKPESVTVTPAEYSLRPGNTVQLTAEVTPSDAADKSITWTSDNDAIATVDENGLVKAISEGTVTITATTNVGGKTASSKITVLAPVSPTGVEVIPSSGTIEIGESTALVATVTPDDAVDKSVTWSSSDDKIATVNENGVVTGVSAGTVTITATTKLGGVKGTATITVNPIIYVESITITPATASVEIGKTTTLTATVSPSNAKDPSIVWSTDNANIATVNANGVVTGVSAGEVTITATNNASGVSESATVTVTEPYVAVTGITSDVWWVSVQTGSTYSMTVTVNPTNATNKAITWSSSDTSIATVDGNGLITFFTAGTVKITATSVDNSSASHTATFQVSGDPVAQGGTIVINNGAESVNVTDGSTAQLTATTVEPAGTSVAWSSSDTSIATVNSSGVVTAKKPGSVTITATGTGTTGKDTITVNVVKRTDVSVTISGDDSVGQGSTITLSANVTPNTIYDTGVTWSSSNESVATVNNNGVVTGVAPGNVTITATSKYDSTKSAVKGITVTAPSISVQISCDRTTVSEGGTVNFTVVVQPSTADQSVTWTVDDKSIAEFNGNTLTALKAGTVSVTATSVADPTKSSNSITITVTSGSSTGGSQYAPTFDSATSYAAGSIVYYNGEYYVHTSPWLVASTPQATPSTDWTKVSTDLTNIPTNPSGSFSLGTIVKVGDKYYTPAQEGAPASYVTSTAWWNEVSGLNLSGTASSSLLKASVPQSANALSIASNQVASASISKNSVISASTEKKIKDAKAAISSAVTAVISDAEKAITESFTKSLQAAFAKINSLIAKLFAR